LSRSFIGSALSRYADLADVGPQTQKQAVKDILCPRLIIIRLSAFFRTPGFNPSCLSTVASKWRSVSMLNQTREVRSRLFLMATSETPMARSMAAFVGPFGYSATVTVLESALDASS
jgi:hypothetical protein